jgi:predicted acetyltransferase
MTPEELTQLTAAHQMLLSHHDREMAEMRQILNATITAQAAASARYDQEFTRIQQTLDRSATQQELNQQEFSQVWEALNRTTAQQELNQQEIANLNASIQELRNLVADYIQSRIQIEER